MPVIALGPAVMLNLLVMIVLQLESAHTGIRLIPKYRLVSCSAFLTVTLAPWKTEKAHENMVTLVKFILKLVSGGWVLKLMGGTLLDMHAGEFPDRVMSHRGGKLEKVRE